MTHILYKCSDPGWEKEFETVESLVEELEKWLCQACWSEEIVIRDYDCMNSYDKLGELLSTACGCEFAVDDDLNDGIYEDITP